MEIWLTILGGVLGIVGAFAGAWIANRYERKRKREQDKRDAAINLYQEYQSPGMLHARIIARNVFAANLKRKSPHTLNELFRKVKLDEWHSISLVITFFEKFGILLKNDYLNRELAKIILEHDFRWWYKGYLERFVKEDDKLNSQWSQSIEYVNQWLTPSEK